MWPNVYVLVRWCAACYFLAHAVDEDDDQDGAGRATGPYGDFRAFGPRDFGLGSFPGAGVVMDVDVGPEGAEAGYSGSRAPQMLRTAAVSGSGAGGAGGMRLQPGRGLGAGQGQGQGQRMRPNVSRGAAGASRASLGQSQQQSSGGRGAGQGGQGDQGGQGPHATSASGGALFADGYGEGVDDTLEFVEGDGDDGGGYDEDD